MAQIPHPTRPANYPLNGFVEIRVRFSTVSNPAPAWPDDPLLRIPKHALISLNLPQTGLLRSLCYVCYCITGSRGQLAILESPVVPAQPPVLANATTESFYFVQSDIGFAIDPELDASKSCTTSSRRDPDFVAALAARERRHCPFTNNDFDLCTASHVIRHNKGDSYIDTLSAMRRGDEEAVDYINDPKNGLLVYETIHRMTANGRVAIIRSPIPGILDSSDLHANVGQAEDIYTIHYLNQNVYEPQLSLPVAPNCHVNVVEHAVHSPPSRFLLNAVYGVHALKAWRNPNFDRILKEWSKPYYSDDIMGRGDRALDEKRKDRVKEAKRKRQNDDRDAKVTKRSKSGGAADAGDENYDIETMDLSDPWEFILWLRLIQGHTSELRALKGGSIDRAGEGVEHRSKRVPNWQSTLT